MNRPWKLVVPAACVALDLPRGDADVDATDERTLAKYKYLAVYGEDARDRADVEAPAAPA